METVTGDEQLVTENQSRVSSLEPGVYGEAVMSESAGKNRHGGGGESPPRGKA